MKKKVLLLGASGLVGPDLAPGLEKDYDLRLTDVKPHPAGLPIEHVDVRCYEQVLEAARGMEAIMNFTVVRDHAVDSYDVNTAGAWHVMKAAAELGIGKVIHSGPQGLRYAYDHDFGVDDAPATPGSSLYMLSKWLSAEICRVFAQAHGIQTAYFVFNGLGPAPEPADGPRAAPPFTVVWEDLHHICRLALEAESIPDDFQCFPCSRTAAPGPTRGRRRAASSASSRPATGTPCAAAVALRGQPGQVGVAESHAEKQRRGGTVGGVGAQHGDCPVGGFARVVGVVVHRGAFHRAAAPAFELGGGVRFGGLQQAEARFHQAAVGGRAVAPRPLPAIEVVRTPGRHLPDGRVPGRLAPARRIGIMFVHHLVQAYRAVTGGAQQLRQGADPGQPAAQAGEEVGAVDGVALHRAGPASGHQAGARRRTQRELAECVLEPGAGGGKGVDVRGDGARITVAAEAQRDVMRDQKQEIGPLQLRSIGFPSFDPSVHQVVSRFLRWRLATAKAASLCRNLQY